MTIVLHVRQFLIRQKSAANHDRTRQLPHPLCSQLSPAPRSVGKIDLGSAEFGVPAVNIDSYQVQTSPIIPIAGSA